MNIIITGATGFVGEGVLLECVDHPQVKQILLVGRKEYPITHPKVSQCIVPDFLQLDAVRDRLKGYDACFYCAGISVIGLNEEAYTRITYTTTLHFAKVLLELNPGMVFDYVTGRHTDSAGKAMWARVKGRTENALSLMPFKGQYNFRPGFMKSSKDQKNVRMLYKVFGILWMALFPGQSCTVKEVGLAMINTVLKGYSKSILEVEDIKLAAL